MGIFDSLKKKKNQDSASSEKEAADAPATGLQVLYASPFEPDEADLTRQLRAYDKSLRAATLSLVNAGGGSFLADVSWGAHAVQVVTIGAPMPKEPVEAAIQPAHYDQETKAMARAHKAHSILFYRGQSKNVSEQYFALALIAGTLCGQSGIAVMNEGARTSLPSRLFTGENGMGRLELFRSLPPLMLFAGFVKYELEGEPGVWMRTHGLAQWGLPDLATHVESHGRGTEIFEIFSDVANYMIAKGPILCAGHTMQVGEEVYMKLRAPGPTEAAMGQADEVLIAEFIRSDEANPFVFNT